MKRGAAALVLALITAAASPVTARAWDSATHRMIAVLAVGALPKSPLREFFAANTPRLERYATEPDLKLRDLYGRAEERRHFIDLEIYGADPWSALVPDIEAMKRKFGVATLDRSGTLPWTIEDMADKSRGEWSKGRCAEVLRFSGYLAHYVGDASQPLHSTIHYDGYDSRDYGLHARIEKAVDLNLAILVVPAQRTVSIIPVSSVWDVAIAEIRQANSHVKEVIDADRSARRGSFDRDDYDRKLMRNAQALFAWQIERAASVLASLWLYEWRQAGSPSVCGDAVKGGVLPLAGSSAQPQAGIPSQ